MNSTLYIRKLSYLDQDVGALGYEDVFGLCQLSDAVKRTLRENPFGNGFPVPAQVLGVADNKVVGQEIVFPVRVRARGASLEAIAGSGLYVHEHYRKSMLGVSLITKREELSVDGIALGCGLSRLALPAHLMFDYLCFPMSRLMWVFKSRAVIEKKLGMSALSLFASRLVDVLLWLATLFFQTLVLLRTRGLVVEQAEHAGKEVANLIDLDSHSFTCERSAAWLDWQLQYSFTSDSRAKQKLFVIKDKESHNLGFFMYKIRFHETASHRGYKNILLGSLTEWQSADENKLSHATIALLAILKMRKDGVDAVEICTDDNEMFGFLKKLRLLQVGELSFVIRAAESSPLRQNDGWDVQNNWRLRPAEGDNGLS